MATQEKSGTQSSQPDPPVEMIDLIDYVKDMTPKWMAIGIKLGQAKIVRLVQNDSSISDKCLEFLIKWHDKGEGVSWSNLVDVLSDDKIQLGRVATKIKKKFFGTGDFASDNVSEAEKSHLDGGNPPATINDMSELIDFVEDIAPKWIYIGIKFGQIQNVKVIKSDAKGSEDSCLDMLFNWFHAGVDVTWPKFLGVLRHDAIGLGRVANNIEKIWDPTFQCKLDDISEVVKVSSSGHSSASAKYSMQFSELKEGLKHIQGTPNNILNEVEKEEKMEKVIDDYINKMISLSQEEKAKEELSTLFIDQDQFNDGIRVPQKLLKKANELLDESKRSSRQSSLSEEMTEQSPKEEDVFSKDNVYHALLCCQALENANPQKFFIDKDIQHSFDALSVSTDDCTTKHDSSTHGQFLLARKENVIFVAFHELDSLQEWKNQCSLDERVSSVVRNLPINYFSQLFRDGMQLVFTGFSLGGSLATALFANVFQNNHFNQESLLKKAACITFGQVPITLSSVDTFLSTKGNQLKDCFHYFYIEEDLSPLLLKYGFVETEQRLASQKESSDGQIDLSSTLLDIFCRIRESCKLATAGSRSNLSQRKKDVKSLSSIIQAMNQNEDVKEGPRVLRGQFHMCLLHKIQDENEESSCFETLSWERSILEFSQLLPPKISQISSSTFDKYTATAYAARIFGSYLDEYSLPSSKGHISESVCEGVPTIDSIELHLYETMEMCIIVKGNELWFARDLHLMWARFPILHPTVESNTGKQFQVNATLDGPCKFDPYQEVTVKLGSCFKTYQKKKIRPTVKSIPLSVRQKQLAGLTPEQLIRLSMLSVVLERKAPSASKFSTLSKRFEAVNTFLERALETVSAESVVYALAASPKINLHFESFCLDLLCSGHGKSPLSKMFYEKLREYIKLRDSKTFPDDPSLFRYNYFLQKMEQRLRVSLEQANSPPHISEESLNFFFDKSEDLHPIKKLAAARKWVDELIVGKQGVIYPPGDELNCSLLEITNSIGPIAFAFSSLVDAFMGDQVKIPLVHDRRAILWEKEMAQESVGIWYLLGLSFMDINRITKKRRIVIEIAEYLSKFLPFGSRKPSGYQAKAEFVNRAMNNTTSCSSTFVTYSLEIQLKEVCDRSNIKAATSIGAICKGWDDTFKDMILSLVPISHRHLVARWIKWTLSLHELREALAIHTTIGVFGLMNSGKSTLMKKIFGQEVSAGTGKSNRTTVPFLYNLGPEAEEIDVIDFPGVDDSDESVQLYCNIMRALAQIIIFVVEYKRSYSEASMLWLQEICKMNIPVCVCLTFGDRIYAENLEKSPKEITSLVQEQIQIFEHTFKEKIRKPPPNNMVCYLTIEKDSELRDEEGRQKLKDVGIKNHNDILAMIDEAFKQLGQAELAEKMKSFCQAV